MRDRDGGGVERQRRMGINMKLSSTMGEALPANGWESRPRLPHAGFVCTIRHGDQHGGKSDQIDPKEQNMFFP